MDQQHTALSRESLLGMAWELVVYPSNRLASKAGVELVFQPMQSWSDFLRSRAAEEKVQHLAVPLRGGRPNVVLPS